MSDGMDEERRRTLRQLRLLLGLVLVGLAASIGWLQLVRSHDMVAQVERQQTRTVYVPAKRGVLADRHGTVLNYTLPSYSLVIRPEAVRDPRDVSRVTVEKIEKAVSELGAFLGPEFYASRPVRLDIENHLRRRTPMALSLWTDLDGATMARWNARRHDFPGTELQLSWKRNYAYPQTATQWRGSTRLERPADPDMDKYWNANFLEPVGIDGLEGALNSRLRGDGGYEVLQTDVLSYRRTILERRLAVNGEDIAMTMDLEAQQFAEKLFADANIQGALVILDSATAEVLVMCSYPVGNLRDRLAAPPTGDYNRCLAGYYPPGSTLKPLVALCALERGAINAEDTFECDGAFAVSSDYSQKCSSRYGHGRLAVVEALAMSCNVFFCETARRMGAQGMDELGQMTVLGRMLGTELWRQEKAGVAFSPSWVAANRPSAPSWSDYDNANAAIGQGGWVVTPMQLAVSFNAIVTGELRRPKFTCNNEDNLLEVSAWSPENRAIVLDGLRRCVEDGRGTGRALWLPGVTMLAKTGTAEIGAGQTPHAWCAAAAFVDDKPKLTGVCIVEHGGGGGKVAAPLLRQALAFLLEQR